MPRLPIRLAAAAALAAASTAPAIDLGFGLLKRRPTPPSTQPAKNDPALKAKQLLATLQSDPDVDRRKAAIGELKAADPRGVADVLPTLLASMQNDPSPAVRAAAVQAVGGLKPTTAAAGTALEAVEKGDPDAGVRAAARAALWQYQLNGPKAAAGSLTGPTGEPPFAKPPAPTPEPAFRPITQGPGKGGLLKETAEPPFAKPKTTAAPRPVTVPAPTIVPPPLPAPLPVPVPMPLPAEPFPTIPVPVPNPTAGPGVFPPVSIPLPPPAIVAPPPGSGGVPTIVPPGGGR